MTLRPEISPHLQRSVVTIEATIPPDMTIADWHKLRASRTPARRQRRSRRLTGRGKLVPLRPATDEQPDSCYHLHDTTTRYDHKRRLLTFLTVCRTCGTEKVVETQRYEPRYLPSQPMRRAA